MRYKELSISVNLFTGIPRRTVKFQEPNTEGAKDNQENVPPQIKNKKKKKKPHIDYSLRVSNIQRNVRSVLLKIGPTSK